MIGCFTVKRRVELRPEVVLWRGAAGPAPGQRVGGEAEEDLAGEGVVARVQRRKLAQQFVDVYVARQPIKQEPTGGGRVFRGGPFSWQPYSEGRA